MKPQSSADIGEWMKCIRASQFFADDNPRNRLVLENLRLVPHIAIKAKRGSHNVTEDDLQRATVALIRCAELYNPAFGFKFSTYACRAIYFACTRKRRHRDPLSLDAFTESLCGDEYEAVSFLDTIDALAVESNCEERVASAEIKAALSAALAVMRPRDAEIISLYYVHDFTLLQIGELYGLTRERVRQIILRGIGDARRGGPKPIGNAGRKKGASSGARDRPANNPGPLPGVNKRRRRL